MAAGGIQSLCGYVMMTKVVSEVVQCVCSQVACALQFDPPAPPVVFMTCPGVYRTSPPSRRTEATVSGLQAPNPCPRGGAAAADTTFLPPQSPTMQAPDDLPASPETYHEAGDGYEAGVEGGDLVSVYELTRSPVEQPVVAHNPNASARRYPAAASAILVSPSPMLACSRLLRTGVRNRSGSA